MSILAVFLAVAALVQPATTPATILARYIQALGGEPALRAVKSRVTEGNFDNGRGLTTRFRIIEEAPNRKLTLIGPEPIESVMGSGRGFDGTRGWDKSFIGTGLRTLEGRELGDAARDADLLRPLHLLDDCSAPSVETTATAHVVVCNAVGGGTIRHYFDKQSGLMTAQDVINGPRKLRITYEDYRSLGTVTLPFRTNIDTGGAIIKYHATAIRLNQPVDSSVFQQPRQ